MSYVPLIAPSTNPSRLKFLCSIADSFIYVVSRMGTTGASGSLNSGLGDLCKRVHEASGNIPIAVGFGVSTRDHFVSVGQFSEGVVIGSQVINVISQTKPEEINQKVKEYCQMIVGRDGKGSTTHEVGIVEAIEKAKGLVDVSPTIVISDKDVEPGPGLMDQLSTLNADGEINPQVSTGRHLLCITGCVLTVVVNPFSFWRIRRSIRARAFNGLPCRARAWLYRSK